MSVISHVDTSQSIALAIIKQFSDQVRVRIISQLINSSPRGLQKLLRYFNGTIIPISFVSSFHVWPVIFCLNLNEALLLSSKKSIITPELFKVGSSL